MSFSAEMPQPRPESPRDIALNKSPILSEFVSTSEDFNSWIHKVHDKAMPVLKEMDAIFPENWGIHFTNPILRLARRGGIFSDTAYKDQKEAGYVRAVTGIIVFIGWEVGDVSLHNEIAPEIMMKVAELPYTNDKYKNISSEKVTTFVRDCLEAGSDLARDYKQKGDKENKPKLFSEEQGKTKEVLENTYRDFINGLDSLDDFFTGQK